MLASTVQQLVGASRDSKLDAYLMLARTLKISDNLPDRIALQSKMSLFTQFLQRDITSSKTPEGAFDSTLVVAALELLSTFLRFSAIASTLSNDFGVFIIDHCIRCFEVASVPRDVLRSLMRVVALQNFPAKVMTSDRVGRLVTALHNMDEQYESKSTIVMRCIIYRTLLKNSKMFMIIHMDWLSDLLTDMISTVPQVREASISLGLEASFALGRERPTSQRVSELLQATVNDERYLDYYASRLQAMTKNKTESSSVPQVWSVLTLFLRTLEKWEYLLKWLHILQDCFNSSDFRTKEEANYAWSRFTYTLLRNNRILSKKMTTVLNQALVSQLRRRGSGKQADDFRRVVLGCVCNLLYYATRDVNQLDNVWDNIVKPVTLQLLQLSSAGESTNEKRKANLHSACAILNGLIDCSTARPWKEDHIAKEPIVAPEDLPAIDVKWLRRNAARVFTLVGPIVEENFLELSTPRSAVHTLWRSLVGAVSLAAAKEIKVSPETTSFASHAFSVLLRVWKNGVSVKSNNLGESISNVDNVSVNQVGNAENTIASAQFLAATREFLLLMVDSLGCLAFTEKQLARDNEHTFTPVATPSDRAGKGTVTRTPLRHLIAILWSLPPGVHDGEEYADFVEAVLAPFFSPRSSDGQRALAMEIIQMTPSDTVCPYGLWKIAGSRIASSMQIRMSSGDRAVGGSGSKSGEANCADLTSVGNHYHYHRVSLSPSAGTSSAMPAGHEFREIAALELIALASHPRDRQATEAAKRRLWGSSIAASGPLTPLDTFDFLYRLMSSTLRQSYVTYDSHNSESVDFTSRLLREVAGYISRFHEELSIKALAAFQDGLADWVCDGDSKLDRQSVIFDLTTLAWSGAFTWIERVGSKSQAATFAILEPLLCAVFTSKHRHTVNNALATWSRIYGEISKLEYPAKLKETLSTLQTFVDLPIPGLDNTHITSGEGHQPMFIDSQDGQAAIITLSSAGTNLAGGETLPATPVKLQSPTAQSPLSAKSPSSVNKVSRGSNRKGSKNEQLGKKKRKPTPARPRHNDSQIDFTAVSFASALPSCSGISAKVRRNSSDVIDESQILTERQREVRDRQRGNRAHYLDNSSPTPIREVAAVMSAAAPLTVGRESSVPLPQQEMSHVLVRSTIDQEQQPLSPSHEDLPLPEQIRAVTPEPEAAKATAKVKGGGAFAQDNFVASTPTPRRGHALVLPEAIDNEIDSPSSPPEPRRYPLLPDISSQSRSSSILDEWQFSSSPLSCSPISARHTLPEPELSIDGVPGGSVVGHMMGQAAEIAAHGELWANQVATSSAGVAASDQIAEPPKENTDVIVENATASVPTSTDVQVAAVPESATALAIPPTRKRSKMPAFLPSPMQTRRRAALSQELSQNSSQDASQEMPRASRQRRNTSSDVNSSFSDSLPAAVVQSSPRSSRRSRRSAASRTVSQSSPTRKSARHSTRHQKPIAVPSTLTDNVSFRMSDGEERSMLRLAGELDAVKNEAPSESLPEIKDNGCQIDSYTRPDAGDPGCNSDRSGDNHKSKEMSTAATSTPDKVQRTPSQRSRRRKRKRSSSTRDDDKEETEAVAATNPVERPMVQAKLHVSESKVEGSSKVSVASASERSLPPPSSIYAQESAAKEILVAPVENDNLLVPEDQEVHSQLAMELEILSQRTSRAGNVVDLTTVADTEITKVVEVVEVCDGLGLESVSVVELGEDETDERPAKRPRFSGIVSMLKSSLALLQAATLSRNEVNQIEDVCMDVKRALYDAERRGRVEEQV
ncbi:hypothetical protein SEPCBS119000_003055 [Sporothrix epigloea]|uniref:Telomere-associated protein Rif1 N-terminal domain-containing protein n=1 Tax=Sporothrix epigloea TaxID=1892477 RepID=A0ABP0DLD8_9PEZI